MPSARNSPWCSENWLRGIKVEKINAFGLELDFPHPLTKYYVICLIVAAALWVVSRVLASPFGAVMEAIRENEKRTAACGYDVARRSCWHRTASTSSRT